jgi:hypothetical protein
VSLSWLLTAAAAARTSFDDPFLDVLDGVEVGLPVGVVEDDVDDGVDGPKHPAQDVHGNMPVRERLPVRI